MASNTARLGLYKRDPVADATTNFNLKTMINDNWDLIDTLIALKSETLTPAAIQTKIDTAITALIGGSPAALDTLNELAAAMGDDPNFAATVLNRLTTAEQDATTHKAENATLTTKGHVQLSSSTTSIDETMSATPKAVKTVKDAIPALNNTVTSTSTTEAATASAVKTAYDKAAALLDGNNRLYRTHMPNRVFGSATFAPVTFSGKVGTADPVTFYIHSWTVPLGFGGFRDIAIQLNALPGIRLLSEIKKAKVDGINKNFIIDKGYPTSGGVSLPGAGVDTTTIRIGEGTYFGNAAIRLLDVSVVGTDLVFKFTYDNTTASITPTSNVTVEYIIYF
jgi:hypothetical protein